MDRELCFCIEKNKLYLEQVLVDYNDTPIFFVCKDDNMAYYAVLCSDIEELSYIVVNCSKKDLSDLLHGSLSMREVFTKQKSYWEIKSGEEIELDEVKCKSIEEIDYTVLPEEGAYFEILTDEVSSYVKKIDSDKDLNQGMNFPISVSIEYYGHVSEMMKRITERYIQIYEGLLKQKMKTVYENKDIAYDEGVYNALMQDTIIPEKRYLEEWKTDEMEKLAYAA